MKKPIASLLALALLAGCQTDVEVPEPAHTPRLVLTYTLSNRPSFQEFPPAFIDANEYLSYSRLPAVTASRSVFDSGGFVGRTDATIEISDASGNVVERFEPAPKPEYVYNYNPGDYLPTRGLVGQPGATYSLRAAAPGLETVESTLTLPALPVIARATFVRQTGGDGASSDKVKGHLTITIADNAATTDYYLVFASVVDGQGDGRAVDILEKENGLIPVTGNRFRLSHGGYYRRASGLYPYPDTDVNGQRFGLSADIEYPTSCSDGGLPCPAPPYLDVTVSSITAATYNFLQSQRRRDNTRDNPFAEPAPLVSNIRHGYGVFGGATDANIRIPIL